MQSTASFTERFNLFLYRQHIRKLGETERETARDWCMALIRREHPTLNDDEVSLFYENLVTVQWSAVDEWTQRMS